MSRWIVVGLGLGLGLAVATGCGNKRPDNQQAPRDARQIRRVIEPSTDQVGQLPPYAIRADGVGPYKLGEKLSDLLEQLASGPRIELFEIAGVVHRNVIRAEDEAILVGGEQSSTASFVAVVGGAEVARTESGIHVGSTRDELVAALGSPVDDPDHARDPRLLVPSSLPNVRVVIGDGRVAAIVVTSASAIAGAVPPSRSDCERPAATGKAIGACMTAAGELLEIGGDDVVVRSVTGERTLATLPKLAGLVFAAALRGPEGRDELVVITRTDEAALRSWWLTAYRFEGTRLVRSVDATQLYQLSTASARWIGADLHDVELYLELTSRVDSIDVGGLLTAPSATKGSTKIRDVVVISPASVARRRGKVAAASEANDAGVAIPPAGASPGSSFGSGPGPGPGPGSPGAPGGPAPPSAPAPASAGGGRAVPDAGVDATAPAGTEADSGKP
jgi:hypothetical protein